MTAMVGPPIAATRAIGWMQLFGLGTARGDFWGRVRGAQLAVARRTLPFNLACLGLNVVAVAIMLQGAGKPGFLPSWGLGVGGILGLALLDCRRRPPVTGAKLIHLWLASAPLLGFGLGWGLLLLHMLPVASMPQQLGLVLASVAVMGSCGVAAATLPAVGIALAAVIATALLAGMPASSLLANWPILLSFGTFTLVVGGGVVATSFAMMSRMRTEADRDEQSAVIGLLLSEFEANSSDWLFEVDADWRLTHVSPRFATVAGRPRETMLGQSLLPLLGSERRGAEARLAIRCLTEHFAHARPFRDLVMPVAVDEQTRWWQLSGSPKRDAHGAFTGFRGVGSDITDVRTSHEQIAHLARFDPLTGLANRSLLREQLEDTLARATRTRRVCALLFVNLDRFKSVNDSLGHLSGDRLLREVAARLREAMVPDARIGRLGGDEFAVVLPDSSVRRAEAAARAIVATLSAPFEIGGVPVSIGASVGFAIGPGDGATVDVLLRSADLALDEVKGAGRDHSCRFVPAIQEKADERRLLQADLRGALAGGQLRLAYQPVVDAIDERIVGFEALLRWHHPTLGLVPPLKFIPIAEETGLIVEIGEWVIREACAEAARWPAHVRIAVNLSPVQFDDPALARIVRAALVDSGLLPARLELEITESLFLNAQARTMAMLAELTGIGISFALDDFGTGYSSFGYLQKVAFSRIKIDRSFVSRSTVPSGESAAIIQAIVALANSLGMATTAEETETREEFEVIRALGCLQVQGYLFGRPMSPEEAGALVTTPLAAVA
ncbi:MAG: putative bifunctional diguanylate cyclase/phosphodiesterase [Janthinobacterium lividum]